MRSDRDTPLPGENREAPTDIATCEADVEQPTPQVARRGRTFEAFQHRDYTLFWSGALVSNTGTWMQNTALALVVYAFRRSELDLGIVNLLQGIPALFLALIAGDIADRIDRRRLIIWGQAILLAQAVAIGYLYASGRLSSANPAEAMAWVSALSLLAGIVSALTFPAWQAMLPDLVPRDTLMNGIALNSVQFQGARMLGPLAASAVLLVGLGVADIFYINAASFLFVIAALRVVRLRYADASPRACGAQEPEGAWSRLLAGARYTRGHVATRTIILSTAMLTIFGFPYVMLMPAIADKSLGYHGPGRNLAVSYLLAANGFGALFGALAVASLPHTLRRENLMRFGLAAMALSLIAFGLSRSMWFSLPLSALAGAMLLLTNSLANTTIQASVPGHLRGRVMALFIMAFLGIMPVSSAVFGPVAAAIGPGNAVVAGATVLLAWSLLLLARPAMLGLDRPAA